jgi:hypothetical protein
MAYIKLKEFCNRNSISYITGYRWFNSGQIPGAIKTDSGTILIPDEPKPTPDQNNDATSLFFKKTLEFSNNESSIEDFGAYIFSTFTLSLKEKEFVPKYSKNKPKPEEIQEHFKRFLPVQGKKPEPNMYIPDPKTLETIASKDESDAVVSSESPIVSQEIMSLQTNYSTLLAGAGSSFDGSFKFSEENGFLQTNYSGNTLDQESLSSTGIILNSSQPSSFGCLSSNSAPSAVYYTNQSTLPTDIDKPKRGRPKKKAE